MIDLPFTVRPISRVSILRLSVREDLKVYKTIEGSMIVKTCIIPKSKRIIFITLLCLF